MFVGICQVSFYLSDNNSLKGKRQVVRKLTERTKSKFNAAVAEVDANDNHRNIVIGCTVVGNDAAHVDAMLSKIVTFMDGIGVATAVNHNTEVINMGSFGDDNDYGALMEDPEMFDIDFDGK